MHVYRKSSKNLAKINYCDLWNKYVNDSFSEL